jgi:hypothetical protein
MTSESDYLFYMTEEVHEVNEFKIVLFYNTLSVQTVR